MSRNNGMVEAECGYCHKKVFTFLADRVGTIPVTYCSNICKSNAKFDAKREYRR